MTNIYLKDEIERKLLKIAEDENTTKNAIIQRIVYAYFEEVLAK
jgi:predicted transcriptional regulator